MPDRVDEAMENIAPPPFPDPMPGDPERGRSKDVQPHSALVPSLAGAAAKYKDECKGGDSYGNNCAHFLSNAMIEAGYSELEPPNDCVNARCGTSAKRVIRAREMWCWFKKKAIKTATSLPKNDGYWAVFQLDESEYWGGHVLIYDSDSNKYYGTGHYPDWDQYCYKF